MLRTERETLGLLSGGFLVIMLGALDQAVVTPALPTIARDLHGLTDLSWVVAAYLLTATTLTLVFGKLSDARGRSSSITFALCVFIVASLLCALARDLPQLIAARALQGVGAGGLIVLGQAMVGDVVGPRERAHYMSYITATFAIATIGGPPLGGFLVEFDWRWCFWINLPLGVLALLLCRRAAPHLPRGHGSIEIDYAGLSLLIGSVVAFLLVCSWIGRTYAWNAPPVVVTAALAIALLVAFIVQERRAATPVFPPRIFAKTIVWLADVSGFMNSVLMLGTVVLIPVFLQLVLGVSPALSGALLAPLMAGTTLGSLTAGQILRRTGRSAGVMPVGLSIGSAGFALLAVVGARSPMTALICCLLAIGVGLGVNFPILGTSVQNAAGPRDLGLATSALQFCRSLGGAFGAAAFWSLLSAFVPHGLSGASIGELAQGFYAVFLIAAGVALAAAFISLGIRSETAHVARAEGRAPLPESVRG